MAFSISHRQGAALLPLLAALAACSSGESSRPGFPRSELTPVADAPFPYATAQDTGLDPRRLWRFKERLYARVVARHLVGSEILVVKDGRIVLHQAMGWADIDRRIPLERNSIFPIASMTKPILGVAVLQLVEQGRIELDAPVATYLPSFDNPRSGGITIRQLLTHRSGFAQGAEPSGYESSGSLRKAVDLLGATGPDFAPGERFAYSGLNSDILGAVIESAYGEPAERLLEQEMIGPLGLQDTHTSFDPAEPWAERVPSLYRSWSQGRWERHWNPLRPHESNGFSPAGRLYATAFDYARFLQACVEGELLADATIRLALEDPAPDARTTAPRRWYGMHWEVYAPPSAPGDLPAFGHRGATGTVGMVIPHSDTIIIYLTNSQENDVVDEVIEESIELFAN
jgi:CubicO group peptidase (beta-lactamase class C family)